VENPRPPLVIAELSTVQLTLRPLDPALDATDLFEMDADPLVHQFVYGSSPSRSIDQLKRRLAADLDQNGGMTWVLRLRDDPVIESASPAPQPPPIGLPAALHGHAREGHWSPPGARTPVQRQWSEAPMPHVVKR
jgi:RimJ/RimL family protein N-acetyltransferase